MTEPDILKRLRDVLGHYFGIEGERIQMSSSFYDDLDLDSLDLLTLVLAVEDSLGLKLPDDAFTGVVTVEQALAVLSRFEPTQQA